jgi:class 3 adenylate cyclase
MTKREEYLTHLGLHAGDVIREENNVYGGAVNIASRISGLSAPGKAGVVAGARPQASAASIACRAQVKTASIAIALWPHA